MDFARLERWNVMAKREPRRGSAGRGRDSLNRVRARWASTSRVGTRAPRACERGELEATGPACAAAFSAACNWEVRRR